jgi:hypothetical protein
LYLEEGSGTRFTINKTFIFARLADYGVI